MAEVRYEPKRLGTGSIRDSGHNLAHRTLGKVVEEEVRNNEIVRPACDCPGQNIGMDKSDPGSRQLLFLHPPFRDCQHARAGIQTSHASRRIALEQRNEKPPGSFSNEQNVLGRSCLGEKCTPALLHFPSCCNGFQPIIIPSPTIVSHNAVLLLLAFASQPDSRRCSASLDGARAERIWVRPR